MLLNPRATLQKNLNPSKSTAYFFEGGRYRPFWVRQWLNHSTHFIKFPASSQDNNNLLLFYDNFNLLMICSIAPKHMFT